MGAYFSGSAAVGTSLTTIGPFQIYNTGSLANFSIDNVGPNALNAFEVDLCNNGGNFYTFLSGSDFSSTSNSNMRFCTTNVPPTLAAAGSGSSSSAVHIVVGASYFIQFRMSGNGGTTQINLQMQTGNS